MKKNILLSFLLFSLTIGFVFSAKEVKAEPGGNPPFVLVKIFNDLKTEFNDFAEETLNKFNSLDQTDVELGEDIADINSELAEAANDYTSLEERVVLLEDSQAPGPFDHIFLNNVVFTNDRIVTEAVDADGYNNITFSFTFTQGDVYLELQTSSDGITWIPQKSFRYVDVGGNVIESVSLKTGGRYYRVLVIGGLNWQTKTISAMAHFFND